MTEHIFKVAVTEFVGTNGLTTEETFEVKEHALAFYNKEGIRAVTEGYRVKEEYPNGIRLSKRDGFIELRFNKEEKEARRAGSLSFNE